MISGDGIVGAAAVVVVAMVGGIANSIRRHWTRVESAVAAVAIDVRSVDAKANDARERLARLEGAANYVIAGQSRVQAQTRETHLVVEQVHEQLDTVNGLSVGELADRAEGRRIRDIPIQNRSDAEQHYVRNLEQGPNGH